MHGPGLESPEDEKVQVAVEAGSIDDGHFDPKSV
jgi:hypothetical protein